LQIQKSLPALGVTRTELFLPARVKYEALFLSP